jgi:WD40 repeat protein
MRFTVRAITFAAACAWTFTSSPWCAAQDVDKPRLTLKVGTQVIYGLAFSADGKTLASSGRDKKTQLWDVQTGENTATLEGHADGVWASAFSPDGKTLVSTGLDGTVKVWDLASRKNTATLDCGAYQAFSVVFADQKTVILAFIDMVKQWDLKSPQAKDLVALGGQASSSLVVKTEVGVMAIGGAGDRQTKAIWDVARQKMIGKLPAVVGGYHHPAFSPNGTMLATADNNTGVDLWELPTLKHKAKFNLPAQITCLAFSPDNSILAVGYKKEDRSNKEGNIRLFDVKTGKEIATLLRPHSGSLSCLAFSPDGKNLASSSMDMTIKVFDVPTLLKGQK